MTDIQMAFFTSALTIIGGVLIYSLSQIVQNNFINPLKNFKETITEISYALFFYADIYSNPESTYDEESRLARNELRGLAAKLRASSINIPIYHALEKMKLLTERNNVLTAYQQLIGISNRLISNCSATFTSDCAM
jgi:hypothetical protein